LARAREILAEIEARSARITVVIIADPGRQVERKPNLARRWLPGSSKDAKTDVPATLCPL
jgi:hypothetical protein